ncbi:MAG TPA: riboflavin biosynthesis protein RibF [Candidatus Limnocylindria bacterium]|nr:riboflavin biosynthesis protein RibF [Candidatus Limnocylindria bacterium]
MTTALETGVGELRALGPAAIAMGVFDGVHLGHRALLVATREAAGRNAAAPVALVFDPHPDEVVRPGVSVARLAPLPRNLDEIERAGVHAVPVHFDERLRTMAPEEFLDALRPALVASALVMTPDTAFGRGRSGTPERMRSLGAERGFSVELTELVLHGGAPISSSRIRRHLADGDLAEATAMLGRRPELVGTVIHGDGRGRQLCFPTANLAFDYVPALPALGIYLGFCGAPGRGLPAARPALVSVGVRPTFHREGRVLVEAYVLDWDGDLYGADLRVEIGERLREERRFDSVDALVEQMRRDEAEARRRLAFGSGAGERKADDGGRQASLVDSPG